MLQVQSSSLFCRQFTFDETLIDLVAVCGCLIEELIFFLSCESDDLIGHRV